MQYRPIRIFAYFFLLIGIIIFIWCDNSTEKSTPDDENSFVVKHLGANLGPYNSETGMAGDLRFTHCLENPPMVFWPYGYQADDGKLYNHITYIMPEGTPLYAIADGYINEDIQYQTWTEDYEFSVEQFETFQSGRQSYTVFYDHVINIAEGVEKGAFIKAGQYLGTAPGFMDMKDATIQGEDCFLLNHLFSYPEITILDTSGTSYCILSFADDNLVDSLRETIKRLYIDWENYYQDSTIYNESAQFDYGCIEESMQYYLK